MSQFHYGSIKTLMISINMLQKICLNSTMVRLKLLNKMKGTKKWSSLNSTMVRLKRKKIAQFGISRLGLNSTMVRLKQVCAPWSAKNWSCLNSTMVRLKLKLFRFVHHDQQSLNSTMVRLKRFTEGEFSFQELRSQFHYGSIKT